MKFESLSHHVIGCAIEVHRNLGPGLLESTYRCCLERELAFNEIFFESEKPLPVIYKNRRIDCAYRIDILVERQLILELKSVETIHGIHEAQLLT